MSEQRRERRRAGVGRGHRRVPGVHHHRHTRLCQQPPDRPQPGLVGREAAHLQMHLEDARSGVERCLDIVHDARFGVERRRRQAARRDTCEFQGPCVEIGGHAGAVRVGQGAVRQDAERPQVRDALLVRPAVADRPGRPHQWPGSVKVLPDPAQQPGRQEMHVDVGEPGHAQRPAEGGHIGVLAWWPHHAHQQIEPYPQPGQPPARHTPPSAAARRGRPAWAPLAGRLSAVARLAGSDRL